MYISPLERMKKIHIWIGNFTKGEEEYEEYFNQGEDTCQFCVDIGIEQYDEDFIGIIPLFNQEVDVRNILNEVPIDERDIDLVIDKAEKLNIKKANAVFYLTDSSVSIKEPYKDSYNELKYIGIFNSDL